MVGQTLYHTGRAAVKLGLDEAIRHGHIDRSYREIRDVSVSLC